MLGFGDEMDSIEITKVHMTMTEPTRVRRRQAREPVVVYVRHVEHPPQTAIDAYADFMRGVWERERAAEQSAKEEVPPCPES
jgi:hypothetical protein